MQSYVDLQEGVQYYLGKIALVFSIAIFLWNDLVLHAILSQDYRYCGGNEDLDLIVIFQTLGKQLPKTGKHFNEFYLNNTLITGLKENTFSDITFDFIDIYHCYSLSTIHRNAFTTTDFVTKEVYIENNLLLS